MANNAYVVFYPYSGAALTSEKKTSFANPATVDPFPAVPGATLTNTSFFPVAEWSTDVAQTLNIGSQSTGAGAGKITFNPFSITRKVDAISSTLFTMSAAGTPFKFVDLLVQKTSGKTATTTYLGYRFGLTAVETIKWADGAESPSEIVTFEYGSLLIGYAHERHDGTFAKMVFHGWDRVTNKKL